MGSSGEFSQMLIVGQKLFSNPGFIISFLGGTGMALTFELPGFSSKLFLQPSAQPAFPDMPLHRAAAQKPWRRSHPLPGPPPQHDNTAARYQAAGGRRGHRRGTAGGAGRGRRCSPRWVRDHHLPGLRPAPGTTDELLPGVTSSLLHHFPNSTGLAVGDWLH